MGSDLVVFLPPGFDQVTGFVECGEPVLVEAFIAELAIEAFDESVLGGFARGNEVQLHLVLLRPVMQRLASELRAVVEGDGLGQAVGSGELRQHGNDARAPDAVIGPEGGTLAGEVIHQSEGAEAAAIGKLVMDEVHAPAFVGAGCRRERHAGSGGQFFAVLATQGELLLTVEPFGAFMILHQAFGVQHVMEQRTTPARMQGGEFLEALAQGGIVRGPWLILQAGAIPTSEAAGAAL